MKNNLFKTKKIYLLYLLSLLVFILPFMFGRPCGSWKTPTTCKGFSEYLDVMFFDIQPQSLPILASFVISLFLISSILFLLRGKKWLGYIFLALFMLPLVVYFLLFRG